MRVQMLYFGVLKESFGWERETVELPATSSVADLLEVLGRRVSAIPGVWGAMAVAVNREYAGRATALEDGDEVALLPPVSGGVEGLEVWVAG